MYATQPQPAIAIVQPVTTYWVTLVNRKTEHEVGFKVVVKGDRVADILAAIRVKRASLGLQGRYEIHEYLAV